MQAVLYPNKLFWQDKILLHLLLENSTLKLCSCSLNVLQSSAVIQIIWCCCFRELILNWITSCLRISINWICWFNSQLLLIHWYIDLISALFSFSYSCVFIRISSWIHSPFSLNYNKQQQTFTNVISSICKTLEHVSKLTLLSFSIY